MVSGPIRQSDVVRADGDTAELGRDIARSRATEARARKQWFLTPLSAPSFKYAHFSPHPSDTAII